MHVRFLPTHGLEVPSRAGEMDRPIGLTLLSMTTRRSVSVVFCACRGRQSRYNCDQPPLYCSSRVCWPVAKQKGKRFLCASFYFPCRIRSNTCHLTPSVCPMARSRRSREILIRSTAWLWLI